MKVSKYLFTALIAFYALLWLGGVISYLLLGGPPADVAWTAPMFLTVAAALTLGFSPLREWPMLLTAAAIGFASEVMGVIIGIPFGGYEYTDTLYPHLFDVPVVMGAAWVVLFAYIRQMRLPLLLAAAWMTAIDLVIDPLAAGVLNYWTWNHPGLYYGIPWTNFVGWYAVSLVLFAAARKPAAKNPRIAWLGLSVVVFFTLIALGVTLFAAGLVGILLILLHWIRQRQAACRSDGSTSPALTDPHSR
jgi:putative membrane protein